MAHAGGVYVFHHKCLLSFIINKAFSMLHLPILITVNCIILTDVQTDVQNVPVDTLTGTLKLRVSLICK